MLDRHEIPTHLGVRDRFLYGLTMGQLALLLLGASSAWATWSDWPTVPASLRAGVALATLLFTLVLALVRPGARGLVAWALVLLRYAATPKRSVWRRTPATSAPQATDPRWASLAPRLAWAPAPAPAEGRP